MNLFLAGGLAVLVLIVSIAQQRKARRSLKRPALKRQVFPSAITALVMAAQLSELIKALEHADIVHVSGAVMLLGVLVASKSGTEHSER